MNQNCFLRLTGDGYPDMLVGELVFSWMVSGITGKQKSYRIVVSSADAQTPNYWDSGWIDSTVSCGIVYGGKAFQSNREYCAVVDLITDSGKHLTSAPQVFSTGFISEDEWTGEWLCSPYGLSSAGAPTFRKMQELPEGIKRARMFISGLGYYELYVNGVKISDRYMDPSWTDYKHRVNYVAHDITANITAGNNVFGVCLGNGWYANYDATPKPAFSAILMLDMLDGSTQSYPTRHADGWLTLKENPVKYNTLYIGEIVDGRLWDNEWSTQKYDMTKYTWRPALESEPPAGKLVPMRIEPIRVMQELAAQTVTQPQKDVYVVDFGQNIAGIIRLQLSDCQAGDKIQIRYAEILDHQGMLSTLNLRGAQARDIYYAKGGKETYQCRFTYHGFRYAEVTGLPAPLETSQIKALHVRNSVLGRSTFETSSDFINRLQKMCVWTESNNLHGVPTDCPQRDERLGWLNDLTVRLEESMFNFDMDRFYRKFLVDIRDAQGKTGAITDTVPYILYGGQPADPVCTSYLLIPYMIYKHYGDLTPLATAYTGLKAWTDYLLRQRDNGIVQYSYFGDWASPVGGNIMYSVGSSAVSAITPGALMSTGFLYMDCQLMQRYAELLNQTEDIARYKAYATEVAAALHETFYHPDQGFYAFNSQAANTFMLYLGIVPDDQRERVLNSLHEDILAHDTHMTTGNLCTRYILDVLSDNGFIDLAYQLVTQTTYPSWGYMMSHGATTTWERWEYVDSGELIGMASHDHPMYSTVSGWFYKYLAGIRPLGFGFDTYELRPHFPADLNHVNACVHTVKGDVTISWTRMPAGIEVTINVPFNSTCLFHNTSKNTVCVTLDGEPAAADSPVLTESGIHTIMLT